jgi:ribosomal protein S18 acetylase RimI-like enzyme
MLIKQYQSKFLKDIIFNANNNVYLWVYKDNIKTVNLYSKLGFNIKEKTDSRYYMEYLK